MRGIGGQVEDRGNVVVVLNPSLPALGFNFACKVDAGATSKDAVIDYVTTAFRRSGLVPHFQLWSITRPDDFGVDLWQRGFQEDGELDVMVWRRPPGVQAPGAVTVRPAHGDADMAAAVDLVIQGFSFPREWKEVMLSSLSDEADDLSGQSLVAEVEGRMVGVAALLRTGDKISGLYSVATAPEFRRRGVATALTLRCIESFRQSGDEFLTLQVHRGSDAQRLYQKLGFDTAYTLSLYTLP
jgi:ribosomal protein S18 acetylase RimI-like enzyme